MAYNPNNPNGQTTMANSAPVTIASNQTALSVDTELPAAAALADGTATPTTPLVGAVLMAFNGTTYDRVRTDGTNNDADADQATGILSVEAHNQIHNGTSWDRIRSIDAMSGTSSNNTVVGIQAVGIGPGFSHRYNTTLTNTLASTATIDVEGGNTMTWSVGTSTTGNFLFEATGDGGNWYPVEVFDSTADLWVSGTTQSVVQGKTYHVACGGFRQVRVRVTSALGVSIALSVNVAVAQQLLAGIDTGAAPHNFGYSLVHKDATYVAQQTSAILWQPTLNRKFVITDLTISSGGTVAGVVTMYDSATSAPYNNQPSIFRGEFAPSTTSKPGLVKSFNVPYVSITASNNLLVTTSTAMNPLYIQVNGYEIP